MRIILLLVVSVCLIGCKKVETKSAEEKSSPLFYVGVSVDSEEWPYRYILVEQDGLWKGEIEIMVEGNAIYFDHLRDLVVTEDRLSFNACIGGLGKAFPMSWELVLTKTKDGYSGVLDATGVISDFEPVKLKFVRSELKELPSETMETLYEIEAVEGSSSSIPGIPSGEIENIVSGSDGFSKKTMELFKLVEDADIVVDYDFNDKLDIGISRVEKGVLSPESHEFDELVRFFDEQKHKDLVVVILCKNIWTKEETHEKVQRIKDYFVARGYQRINIQQAYGGGRGLHLDHVER